MTTKRDKMFTIAIAPLAFGCSEPADRVPADRVPETELYEVCACDQEKLGVWMLECIERSASSSSGDDPEDRIKGCESVAVKIHCGEDCYRSIGGDYVRVAKFKGANDPPSNSAEREPK